MDQIQDKHPQAAVDDNQSGLNLISVNSDGLPTKLHDFSMTTITAIGTRLTDGVHPIAGSGDAVSFANGGFQVWYDSVPQLHGANGAELGDPVMLELVEIPKDCPAGDERGKVYKATDLRTHTSWEGADSEHSCGGA